MGDILRILKNTDPLYFLMGFFLQLLAIFVISARLRLIFKAQGLFIALGEAVELSFMGIFFNNFLPTAAGGDLPKAFYAYKKTNKKIESFACVLGDRIIGLFSLIFMAMVGVFCLWGDLPRSIKLAVGILFLISSFCILFLFNRRLAKTLKFLFIPFGKSGWDQKVERLYQFLNMMSRDQKLLYQSLLYSMAAQTLAITSVFVLIQGLSATESFVKLFVVLPLVSVASMIPSLNGLGIREGAFVYFLGGSIGKGSALALSLLWLLFLGLESLIGAFYYLFYRRNRVPLAELKNQVT